MKICLILFFIIIFLNCAFASLKITAISNKNNKFNIILNNSIQILNIELQNNELKFPTYKSKNKQYQQFSILKRDFKIYLKDSLLGNKVLSNNRDISFNTNKLYILRNNTGIKAFASVIFDNEIEIECRIIQGKNSLWIAWPSNKINDRWVKNFKFIDKNLQKKVETKLIVDYTTYHEK
ncbi:MAG: SpoVG family protein [Endomicrobium sp.]|jgi:DNA-binding cell septation regulator SpoVG|uniref:septation protein SpoVG family protein n=1 Tax=Candidatus Endomicrobiellum cubanum TaxID=3242325 RepID=UPI00282FB9F7|nr:SpoVG family protein [Endomicrobium sp.]